MTTINDIRDLIRIVEDHPEWRSELQRLLLTRELLDTPDKITELTAVTENIAKAASSLLEVAEATNNRLDAFDSRFDRIDEKMDGVNRDLGKKIDEISTAHREEHDALHRFRGNYAIEATRNNRADIARKFIDARGINRHRYRLKTLSDDECNDLFDENLDAIELLDTEGNISETFPEGDMIAEATYRRSGDTIFYIAVEASYTVNASDVIRASDHAKILRGVEGREAFAIVSGVEVSASIGDTYRQRIIEDLTEYLESERDDVVFWFQLADRSLEPPPPC